MELLKVLRNLIESQPLFEELEVVEILQSFSRGNFGIIFNDQDVKKFGGTQDLQKLSLEILKSDKILHNSK
ncbi:MAG: hypothetical protein EXR06_03865 [Rickettsiales bacterium]|nr:hypothetical protein [Rickettsiales bacterium]